MTKQRSSTVIAFWLASLLACLSGCASQGDKPTDAGDASADQLSCEGQAAITCLIDNCGNDEGTNSLCVNGVQKCPPGSVQCSLL
jgi:hypothetical protein